MSTWGIGDQHDSDQVQALKDQLRNKDAQYATLHSQLLKREGDLKNLRDSFDDVVTKLRREADSALQLEADIKHRAQELQNERTTRQNMEAALTTTQQKLKTAEQASRELEATLDSLSKGIQSTTTQKGSLETENALLKAKVRNLQTELVAKEQAEQPTLRQSRNATTGARDRPRSSSVNNFRVTTLERESADLHNRLAQQTTELREAKSQMTRLQETLVQRENEMIATERQFRRELNQIRSELEDRQEELRTLGGSGSVDTAAREADLLERLEDEEQRVAILEAELKRSSGTTNKRELAMLQAEVQRTLGLLQDEQKKVVDAEARLIELVADKEAALDERDQASQEVRQMREHLHVASNRMQDLEAKLSTSAQGPLIPLSPGRDAETAATIERLLKKIESLRNERDGLRYEHEDLHRRFEFLNDESRFAIEDLREKLVAASVAPSSTPSHVHATTTRLELVNDRSARHQRRMLALALVVQHVVNQDAENLLHTEALSQALSAAQGELVQAHHALTDKETHICALNAALEDKVTQLHQIETTLSETTQNLNLAESTIAACKDIIARMEAERSCQQDMQDDAGTTLARTEARQEELSQALLEAENERDALALQLQHKQQDLETARQELTDADERSAMQLRSLSAGQPDKALHNQIKALQERVDRRTEQIGIHQHDIKRLETNLRLQEERLAEMTAELEVMTGEKEAMVEDCRVSREERDEARSKCEMLEEKTEQLEEERDGLQTALNSAKQEAVRLTDQAQQLAECEPQLAALHTRLSETELHGVRLLGDLERLQQERDHLTQMLDEKSRFADAARRDAARLRNDTIQTTIALAILHAALRASALSSRSAHDAKVVAQRESVLLRQDVEDKVAQLASSQQQIDALRELQAAAEGEKEAQLMAEHSRLQEELQSLRSTHSELRSTLERDAQRFARSGEESQQKLAEGARTELRLREELTAAQIEKTEAIEALQTQLDDVAAELQAAQAAHDQAKRSHLEVETALTASKQELESRLDDALARLRETDRVGDELSTIRADQEQELEGLRKEINLTKAELEENNAARKELSVQCQDLLEEVESLKANLSEKTKAYEAAEAEFEQLKECELKEMQGHLDSAAREVEQAQHALIELEAQYQQLSEESVSAKDELQNRLTSAQDEVDYLKATLRGEMEMHARTQKHHEEEIRCADDKTAEAERASGQLRQEISVLRAQLEEADFSLQSLEDERTALQYEATSMSAEVQRLKSLQRYLESQVKESESRIHSLVDDLDEARTKLVQTEKTLHGLEAESSMRQIQQEQTIHALKRDLQALRSNPSLEEKLADLEERNVEMEELLRNKCVEIEENDDRFIDLLKEKKKLTAKIDSLTRKLHAANVAASSAGASAPTVQAGPSAPMLRPARSTPVLAPQPVTAKFERMALPSLPTPTPTTPSSNSRARLASGPSALPRPMTPGSRTSQPAVFRARTPEARRTPSHAPSMAPIPAMPMASSSSLSSMTTTSTAGKKRRAPDDFDDCEELPPQGFTADCLPVNQLATPRARRALQAVRTGFTPVRNGAQLSPRRATTVSVTPAIADVTNSPRGKGASQEPTKRGWLGKIRSGSGQARAVSSRPAFERR